MVQRYKKIIRHSVETRCNPERTIGDASIGFDLHREYLLVDLNR
jgi:hypothetical protein